MKQCFICGNKIESNEYYKGTKKLKIGMEFKAHKECIQLIEFEY